MAKTNPVSSYESRLSELLDAAARLFAQRGYVGTSMRDIADEVHMLAGSVYYHFASKEDLLIAVYKTGVATVATAAQAAISSESDPWHRLQALCQAHLETVLHNSNYAQVIIRVRPEDIPNASEQLRKLRDGYEDIFRDVIGHLPLHKAVDRKALRLMLMGALNWTTFWFNSQGRDSPRVLAKKFVAMIQSTPNVSVPA
jgi:AcrR family transcriptional regulator